MKKKLWADKRGTITVIVSIMLIPAILLSGTAVDLSRIHTAKSIAHNANQLAANSILTEYNALLKDLYGLFGVADNDPVLADMVNEYIQVAVFGESSENWIDNGLGTLQLFHNSTASADMKSIDGYNLGSADVLRRQIEEYMKFRGPVILVSRLLDALSVSGPSIKPSKDALDQQEIFSQEMLKLFEMFSDLYNKIVEADECQQFIQLNAIDPISTRFNEIKSAFVEMKKRHATWDSVNGHINTTKNKIENEEAKTEPDEFKIEKWKNDLEMYERELEERVKQYDAQRNRIVALTNGGDWYDWSLWTDVGKRVEKDSYGRAVKLSDGETDRWEWVKGEPSGGARGLKSIQTLINEAKQACDAFKPNFTRVLEAAKNIDNKRTEVYRELNTLQQKIDDPNCDETLRENMQEQIDICKDLLDRFPNIKAMAETYETEGNKYINDTIKRDLLDKISDTGYRDRTNSSRAKLSLVALGSIAGNSSFKVDSGKNANNCEANTYALYSDVTYRASGFKKFRNINSDDPPSCVDSKGNIKSSCNHKSGHCAFYDTLEAMANGSNDFTAYPIDGLTDNSNSDEPGEKQKSVLKQLTDIAERVKNSLVSEPEGAREISDPETTTEGFGTPDLDRLIDFVTDPAYAIQNLIGQALLLTYGTSMFSSYTTGKPKNLVDEGSVPKPDSLTGVPMNPKVNYFYQSEWEYLLVGHQDAVKNLDAVKNSIYAIRLVCNTIAAFSVRFVKETANTIKQFLYPIPYVGPALGVVMYFATFAAFAAAESAYDMVMLRNGCRALLLKNNEKWTMQASGFVSILENLKDGSITESIENHEEETGVSYEDYLLIFLLITTNIDALVTRMSKLIEWNTNNYLFQVNADNMKSSPNERFVNTDGAKAAMATALANPKAIRLKKMNTDFNITTTINLRLYFLTMPLFKSWDAPFSKTFPVHATDYRGY